jgi:hypothetical protein
MREKERERVAERLFPRPLSSSLSPPILSRSHPPLPFSQSSLFMYKAQHISCHALCVCGVVCVGSATLAEMTAKMSRLGSGNRGGQVKSPDVSERGCLLLGLRRFQHFISSGKEDVFHSARGVCKWKIANRPCVSNCFVPAGGERAGHWT